MRTNVCSFWGESKCGGESVDFLRCGEKSEGMKTAIVKRIQTAMRGLDVYSLKKIHNYIIRLKKEQSK